MRRQILPFGKHCTVNTFQGLNKVSNINYVGHSYKLPYTNLNQQPLGSANAPFQYPIRHFHTSPIVQQNDSSGSKWWFYTRVVAVVTGVTGIVGGIVKVMSSYEQLKKMDEERMKKLYSKLEALSEKCTTSYIQFDDKTNTNGELKEIEGLLNNFLDRQKLDSSGKVKILDTASSSILDVVNGPPIYHLSQNNVDEKYFIYLLHVINSMANYHMYRNHDREKAKELLLKGKSIVEWYLTQDNPRLKLILEDKSFDELTYRDQLNCLKKVNKLAETYCSTLYLLGRSYTYSKAIKEQKAQEQAKKYFEISKYLAQELGLFEFVISQRSGMCRIEEQEIKDLIKQDTSYKVTNQKEPYHCNTLSKRIDDMIDKFQNLKKVEDGFIEDFNIHKDTQKSINPKQDAYHQVECSEQLLKYYGQAIGVTKDQNKIEEYLDNIHSILVGENNLTEEFESLKKESLEQKKGIPYKKYASVYNTIGNLAVILSERFECKDAISDSGIKNKLGDLRSEIVQLIENLEKQTDSENFKHNSDLDSLKTLAYDIFKAAIGISETNVLPINFTELDAHHGQLLCLNEGSLEYTKIKGKEDRKNKTLKREHDYTSVLDSCCFVKGSGPYDCGSKSGDTNLAGEEAAL